MGWGIVNSASGTGGGGIAPGNMKSFMASSEKGKVKLHCVLPDDTVVEGMLLATVAGAKILRRVDRFPETEYDGDLVKDLKKNEDFVDQDTLTGATYYYAAFPYTDTNVYNRNPANRAQITPKLREYLYGYDITLADEHPSSRVTYPSGVDNAGFVPVKMNFSSGKFEPGSWDITPGHHFMPKPCMLGYDGQVYQWLDPDNYANQTNGQRSDIGTAATPGNAMMQWPKIYTMRWESDGKYHFRCSDQPIDQSDVGAPPDTPDSDCWCNYDINDNQIPFFYTGIYHGWLSSGRIRSLSGVGDLAGITPIDAGNAARANGNGWDMNLLVDQLLISDLTAMIAKNTDTQTVFGNGNCNSGAYIKSGTMDKDGLFWGSNRTDRGVKIFGMENIWGNYWRYMAGLLLVSGSVMAKFTTGTHDGSTVSGYDNDLTSNPGKGYIPISGIAPKNNPNGYINAMRTTKFGRIPSDNSGSSSTYEADRLWWKPSSSDVNYAAICGDCTEGAGTGMYEIGLVYTLQSNSSNLGASLSCKPALEV